MPATHPGHPHVVFAGRDAEVVPPCMPRGADLPSILVVHARPSDLSEGQLAVLDALGQALTERYDAEVGGPRRLANLAETGPLGGDADGPWFARKFTWTVSPRVLPDAEGAAAFLSEAYGLEPATSPSP